MKLIDAEAAVALCDAIKLETIGTYPLEKTVGAACDCIAMAIRSLPAQEPGVCVWKGQFSLAEGVVTMTEDRIGAAAALAICGRNDKRMTHLDGHRVRVWVEDLGEAP